MKIPNGDRAVISEDKIRNYFLNVNHRRGAPKSRLLLAMGYTPEQWDTLEADIRARHLAAEVDRTVDTAYGTRYEVVAELPGTTGAAVTFRSVWQVDTGTNYPRLITMYPE